MAKKQMIWKTKGMNRDLSVSAFNPEFAFENMNLRLSTNEGNTLLSWVNERGTEAITWVTGDWKDPGDNLATVTSIDGTPVGTAVLNHQLILFTHGITDRIYVIKYNNHNAPSIKGKLLYQGNLNLDVEHPLETLVSYESENVQKVYWVDGKNQPRLVNIAGDNILGRDPSYFDFVNELQLNEIILVKKLLGASGMFAPGVIQYAFTYYNKNGQETNIFYTTPLYYTSHKDRGASPEDKVENAFQITIKRVDRKFDYLRIYSILRTSINGTPICKRIQDIDIQNIVEDPYEHLYKVSYIDTGTTGDNIDPTELFYKGGETITASTIEQKDNTLFLGDICILRNKIENTLAPSVSDIEIDNTETRFFFPTLISSDNYLYANQLTSYEDASKTSSTPCAGFKAGNKYRLGIQFQHKTGKWSDPIYIKDESIPLTNRPTYDSVNNRIDVPVFKGTLKTTANENLIKNLYDAGYRKVRAVVVYPNAQDRKVICQGVSCPTLSTSNHSSVDNDLHAQSSWFFRPNTGADENTAVGTVSPNGINNTYLPYIEHSDNPTGVKKVEIQGAYDSGNKFKVDFGFKTLHSPDIEFDDSLLNTNFIGVGRHIAGGVTFNKTLSDISIQTETPTASSSGSGFIHKSFIDTGAHGIVSGLFYDDFVVVDDSTEGPKVVCSPDEINPVKWMVYLWNKTGSLNNDINRPADSGVNTAVLKKKIVSNLRISNIPAWRNQNTFDDNTLTPTPEIFSGDNPTILKFGSHIYMGNIDTIITPDTSDGMYFAFNSNSTITKDIDGSTVNTLFTTSVDRKTYATIVSGETPTENAGIYKYEDNAWDYAEDDIGNEFMDLVMKKGLVRMKYKSTPHLLYGGESSIYSNNHLNIVEIYKKDIPMIFGGDSKDALRENIWVPCGKPIPFSRSDTSVSFEYSYGDTYFQRYDCLKTYAYTPEDENQVVEIGSFMLETYVNIDGRYDRNRGQINNLNMSPRNFNLINPVYSQIDNFFSYKIMPDDAYNDTLFPNQITWSKTKESGADVDQWTNVTLASVLELDGDKGKLNKLIRLNDQLLAFQDTGISQILYNENVQVSSTDGVPIEIANSGKVQGKRYLSNTIGCSNKWSITTTPAGIYFMDSHDKSIYLFNGQLTNISNQGGFASWAKNNISLTGNQWRPDFSTSDFVAYYDKLNQDVLWINSETALAWSEKLGAFTSFYSYEGTPFFCNLDDTGVWITNPYTTTDTPPVNVPCKLWKHQAGDYCKFFNQNRPYWMTLVGNPEPQIDKIFTNLEFRATVDTDGTVSSGEFTPLLPFNSLETWNEYQHGLATLQNKSGHAATQHNIADKTASLKRKFRIWRCDIPRDNVDVDAVTEIPMGIFRKAKHPIDRMRNPWLYLKLTKNAENTMQRSEIHDLMMAYFT